MVDENTYTAARALAMRLTRETGISEIQPAGLIAALGFNWPSLAFEAKLMHRQTAEASREPQLL